jgi:propanol-preferring alcohol dehydrogenase
MAADTSTMRAWVVRRPGPIGEHPLAFVERTVPSPGPGEVRLRVSACGVCRTDLHLAEGDLQPHGHDVIPGHEIVGIVEERGEGAARFELGERVGVAWLRRTCGRCRFCRRGAENLCLAPRFTGWDDDGGYAERAVVDERFAYRLPERFSDEEVAPLLCAGIIGYRALRRAEVPPNGRLGIYGFGASAHLAAQVAMAEGASVHVFTRSAESARLAESLGATWVGGITDAPPDPLDSAITFAPAGELVPVALRALDRGGTLSIAGIHLTPIPPIDYDTELFEERQVRSVTANTRRDGEELLAIAAQIPLHVATVPYDLASADVALRDLADDRITGAAVLRVRGD